jgi:hypothetical protein
MLTMQSYLALFALLIATAAEAQGTLPVAQQMADASPVTAKAAPAKPPRHQLSAEQRAELRRQLYQFSRLSGKAH